MDVVKYMCYGLLVGVPVAVTLSDQIGCPAKISGPSMRPALNPASSTQQFKNYQGDIVWLSKLHWKKYGARLGDVVALKSPLDPTDKMVKRVVGTEKDVLLTRGYKHHQVLVPEGHLWVEGDNVKRSKDSNMFGPVSQGLVIGTVTHVVWPLHRMQKIEHVLSSEQCKRRLHEEDDDCFYD